MNCNVNFKGRLDISEVEADKARWRNISKIFKEETKGINYETRVYYSGDKIQIFTDRIDRKNRPSDIVDKFESRDLYIPEEGAKDLLAQPDDVVAKVLAEHVKFVQKLDNSCKLANTMLNKAFGKLCAMFEANGFDTECVYKMFGGMDCRELGRSKVVSEYQALKKLPGLEDADGFYRLEVIKY